MQSIHNDKRYTMTTPHYIMKNNHQHETPNFCIYDKDYNFIEERSMSYSDASALNLVPISPMQLHHATSRR